MILRAASFVLPAVLVAALAGVALGGSQAGLAGARQATAAFHDLAAAEAAGYTVELPDVFGETCIANLGDPSAGAMGVHMVSLDRVLGPALDEADPEVLVYERRNDGSLKLVALEYVVFDTGQATPELFGVPFNHNNGSRYGLPPFYALHAWIWKPNPSQPGGSSATGTRAWAARAEPRRRCGAGKPGSTVGARPRARRPEPNLAQRDRHDHHGAREHRREHADDLGRAPRARAAARGSPESARRRF